jgi:hypothetical protein
MMGAMNVTVFHNHAVVAGHRRLKDGVAVARLCPAVHALILGEEDVDARDKPGHDDADRNTP